MGSLYPPCCPHLFHLPRFFRVSPCFPSQWISCFHSCLSAARDWQRTSTWHVSTYSQTRITICVSDWYTLPVLGACWTLFKLIKHIWTFIFHVIVWSAFMMIKGVKNGNYNFREPKVTSLNRFGPTVQNMYVFIYIYICCLLSVSLYEHKAFVSFL